MMDWSSSTASSLLSSFWSGRPFVISSMSFTTTQISGLRTIIMKRTG